MGDIRKVTQKFSVYAQGMKSLKVRRCFLESKGEVLPVQTVKAHGGEVIDIPHLFFNLGSKWK